MTFDDIEELDPELAAKIRSEVDSAIRLSQITRLTATECGEIVRKASKDQKDGN